MPEDDDAAAPETNLTDAQVANADDDRVADWSPPELDPATGYEMIGDYPATKAARLRAITADKRRKSDPDGILTDEEIAAYRGDKA